MTKSRSTRLMHGGAMAALAMALLQPAAVHAQTAFQGVPTVVTPGSAIVQQGPVLDTIFVLAPEAVINWRIDNPAPGNFNFLPQGRTGRFVGFADFVVLNRILPTSTVPGLPPVSISRLIELNGTINSEIDLSNQSGGIVQGGSVWFYSAGGILVGGSAAINVGSLVLTSNDIDTTGGLFGPGGEIRFVGTAASGSVTVANGAQIDARNPINPGSSYVALVAPRVVQSGTINADGSTALVAAQAAEITINTGLFDIRVSVGTDDPNGIVHTGTTGGPLDTSGANASRVYMVAVPRNTAIEMLLSGTVGFQTAGVSAADGAIVISAGRDIVGGVVANPTGSGVAANVRMGDLLSYNGIDVVAEGDIIVSSATTACNGCRILDINGSANLFAQNAVRMTVGRGQEVFVTGNLTLDAEDEFAGLGGLVSLNVDRSGPGAGNAALNGGIVRVFGNLSVDASANARGGNALDGAGIGGTATLVVDGGAVLVNNLLVDGSGRGARTDANNGANGTGGSATMIARNGGTIGATTATVQADGIGGGNQINFFTGLEEAARNGGSGFGGTALARVETGGQINLTAFSVGTAELRVTADGLGSIGIESDGDGVGGARAAVEVADAASAIRGTDVTVTANGFGGVNNARNLILTSVTGGDGTGGLAEILVSGELSLNNITIQAIGGGSNVAFNPQLPFLDPASGGDGVGGTARLVYDGVTATPNGFISIAADGQGGNASAIDGVGGNAVGGTAELILNGAANLTPGGPLSMTADGIGGAGGDTSGDGSGGLVRVALNSALARLTLPDLILTANGRGGGSGDYDTEDGGDGFGGTVEVVSAGTLDIVGAVSLTARGIAGDAVDVAGDPRTPQAGNAAGGIARLSLTGGTFSPVGITLDAGASAASTTAESGDATGGTVELLTSGNARVQGTGAISLISNADAGTGATAGVGRGGSVLIRSTDASELLLGGGTSLTASASTASPGGFGGIVTLRTALGGRMTLPIITLDASSMTAGQIIIDSPTITPSITIRRLTATALGTLVAPNSGISIFADNNIIAIAEDATFDTDGNITANFARTGGLLVSNGTLTMRTRRSIIGTQGTAFTPTFQVGGDIIFDAGGDIQFGPNSFALGSEVRMRAGGALTFDMIEGNALVALDAANINVNQARASGILTLNATGLAVLGEGLSGGDTVVNAANIQIGSARTTGLGPSSDFRLTASGDVSLGSLISAEDIVINAATLSGVASAINAAQRVDVTTSSNARFGQIVGGTGVSITSGGFVFGDFVQTTIGGGNIVVAGATDVTIATTNSLGGASISSTNGGVSATNVTAAGNVALIAATVATSSFITSTGGSILVTGGIVGVGTANAATTLTLQSADSVSLTNGTSGGTMTVSGTGIVVQNARTTGVAADIILTATQNAALGTATAGRDIRVTGPNSLQLFGTTQVAGRDVILVGGNLFNDGTGVTAGRAISVTTTGLADVGNLTAVNGITVSSGARVTGGAINSTGAGSAVDIAGAGPVTLTSVNSGGSTALRSTGGALSVGTVNAAGAAALNAATTITATQITSSGGAIAVTSGSGATIGTANAATTLTIEGGTGTAALTSGTSGGTTRVNGNAVTIGSAAATGAGADILIAASQAVTLGTLNASRDISITAATLAGATSSLTAGGALGVTTSGDASFGTALSGGPLTMASGGGLTGTSARSTGGAVSLTGANGVTVGAVQSAGATALAAVNGAIAVNNLQSVGSATASGRSVAITTRGGVTFGTLVATAGDARVTAATGDLNVTSGSATGTLALTTTVGNLTTGSLSGGAIALGSNGTATLNGATTATGALTVDAVGNAAINAVATGATVTVRSGNIAIGIGGRLGTAGTTSALLLSNTDTSSRTFIGGADVTGSYSLSATEMLRLFGGNITINAPRAATQGGTTLGSTRPPDVVIGAFTLQGGAGAAGNLGANGTLTIDTPGSARVTGAVALEGMSLSNRFLLSATEAIEVIAGQGSIRMSNGAALSGIIELRSDDIAVATSAAITAIAGLTSIDAIDDRLGQSDGVVSDEGVLAANGIRMTVRNGVYIQNTGTGTRFADRRGFTTGVDGLTITTAGPATRIVINGRIPNAAGTLATGRDTIPLIRIVGAPPSVGVGQFDQGSTANGCLIANPAACFEGGDNVPPVQDIIDDTIGTGDGGIGETPFALLIQLRDLEPLPGEPLIDDPVTGTGNDDLWTAPCEPAEGEEACP